MRLMDECSQAGPTEGISTTMPDVEQASPETPMSTTWFVIAMLVLLHTVWTIAHAIANKGQLTKGAATPHKTLPYVWGAVSVVAIGQILFILILR